MQEEGASSHSGRSDVPREGTYSSWLTKVKSDRAFAKFLTSTTKRYYTIDFGLECMYYSHSADQKDVSQPIHFKDILGAEELPPSAKATGAFVLRTAGRTYELRAASNHHATQWVRSLNEARDIALARLAAASAHPAPAATVLDRRRAEPEPPPSPERQRVGPFRDEPQWVPESAADPVNRARHPAHHMPRATAQEFERQNAATYARLRAWGEAPQQSVWESDRSRDRWMLATSAARDIAKDVAQARGAAPSTPEDLGWSSERTKDLWSHAVGAAQGLAASQRPAAPAATATSGHVYAGGAGDLDERMYRMALMKLPCTLRSEVANRIGHATWAAMTWAQRLATVENEAGRGGLVGRGGGHRGEEAQERRGAGARVHRRYSGPLHTVSKLERLKLIFDTNDGLQALVGHHLDHLVLNVINAMRSVEVKPEDRLIRQGQQSDTVYIVDEGTFDVLVEKAHRPPVQVCQYGPGTVFGELAISEGAPRAAPRAATVKAASAGRVWMLDRDTFQSMLKAPVSTKTIGLIGGVMMLINNLAGPTIVSMPGLAQEAGWLAIVLVQLVVAAFAAACGYMLLGAMRRMPGNANFEQRIEFTNLAMFYLPRWLYVIVMLCYHVNTILSLMSLIIQSGQVVDYLSLNMYGCAPGLELRVTGPPGYVCGTRKDSSTPFGDSLVISSSMVVVAAICAPFAMKNLDDNVVLQYLAIAGLSVMTVVWVSILVAEPAFPAAIPAATASQSGLLGTVLFNFAFASALPSWVNEKKREVSIAGSFALTMVYVVGIYSLVGIVGGMAYEPYYETDENLFSKLSAGGSVLGKATVTAYPILQNFTSIPVFSILIRYNLVQSGLYPNVATFIAVGVPWFLSVPFYTGSGFESISEVGGLLTSSIINFIVPIVLFALATMGTARVDADWV